MKSFNEFFLMTSEDAGRYAADVLHRFSPGEELACDEIGDGNINYVFRIRSKETGRSLIVKQADRLLRSSGRPLDVRRSEIEAEALKLEGKLAPGLVPEVYHYDAVMAATAMEDVSAYANLRAELQASRVYPHLAGNLSTFLADTLLPTTDLVMDSEEKKLHVRFFTNPELCRITEDLVLTEPYYDYKGRNVITPGNETFVEKYLYSDDALKAEVGALRLGFMSNAQALLHGDLHSGSIFANERGVKILDPEFAFYGPMGYDIGNVIGNLFFSWANKAFTMPEEREAIEALSRTVASTFDLTREKLAARYDALVTFPFYRVASFRQGWIDGVMSDAVGYAGTEIVRRVVGDAKVSEVTSVSDPELRVEMERALIKLGVALIKGRGALRSGRAMTDLFRLILA